MAGVNKVILIGNLGKDPETRFLESGQAVTSFSMATSETYNDKKTNEKVTATEWHNIVMWGKLAEIADKYLKKGSKIYCEGKLKSRSYDQEGVTKYTTEVVVNQMQMLDGKQPDNSTQSNPTPQPEGTDDLPF